MKDSTGDFERHEAYLDALDGRDFELYVGSEPLVLRAYRRGAAGAVTGLAGAAPTCSPRCARRSRPATTPPPSARRTRSRPPRRRSSPRAPPSPAVKRRVAAALAERGVAYPPAPRPPFA